MTERDFLTLLEPEQGRLLRVAWAILGQEPDAWDALQAAVEAAWRQRGRLRGGADAFPAWIRRILVNQCINELHRRKRVVLIDFTEEAGAAPAVGPDAAMAEAPTAPALALDGAAIWNAVRALEQGQRQVVALRYLGDLTIDEIAAQLKLPAGTVKSRLSRAIVRLHSRLSVNDELGRAGHGPVQR